MTTRSLLLASTLVCAALVDAQTISFLPPVDAISVGSAAPAWTCAACLATADFDGDGKPDLVMTRSDFPAASVVFGNGDGTFRNGPSLPLTFKALPVVGDFNGDGKADIILVGGATSSIYLSAPASGFLAPYTLGECNEDAAPAGPGFVVAADLNHDGKADLVCENLVLLSVDGVNFTRAALLDGNAVLTADFNGDGKPDLLLVNSSGNLAIALGNGDGTFGSDLPITAAIAATAVAGDFNGDGHVDLAAPSLDQTSLLVLPGIGDGTFGTPIVSTGAPAAPLAAADFNRDGKLDLMAADATLAGNGDGTFRFPVYIGATADACGAASSPNLPSYFPCSYTHTATAIADFNGDGLPDIAAGVVIVGPDQRGILTGSVLLNDSPGDGFTATGVSAATGGQPVGAGSIVSAFGVNLAPTTEPATTNPAPTTLGGIRLHVRDRSHAGDMLAPLLYVSPTQINYVLPSSDPFAFVSIERVGSRFVAKGMAVQIQPVAPGFFTGFADFAAATALRVNADGSQTKLPVFTCVPGACASIPIDVSSGTVYLSLYGTGFDQAVAAACTVAGKTVTVTYSGPEMAIAGLDQVNLLLPGTLAGSGTVPVQCGFSYEPAIFLFGTAAANPVKVTIR